MFYHSRPNKSGEIFAKVPYGIFYSEELLTHKDIGANKGLSRVKYDSEVSGGTFVRIK